MIKDIIVKETNGKGKGVFALRNFRKGEFIFRGRKGKIVKVKAILKLPLEKQNHINQIAKGVFEVQRSPECYVNHSCSPNTISKGRSLYALKPIKKREEITSDYRIGALNEGWKLRCVCGSKNCTGTILGDFFTLSEKLQKKYFPHAPKFIQKEYKKRHKL